MKPNLFQIIQIKKKYKLLNKKNVEKKIKYPKTPKSIPNSSYKI